MRTTLNSRNRAMMKQAKGVPTNELSANEQQAIQQMSGNLIPCPTCGRKFNEQAAERHFPICANKSKGDNIKATGKGKQPAANSRKR